MGAVVPTAFCLLPDKTESTYITVFEELKEMMSARFYESKLHTFRSDFEKATMNAITQVFPGTKLEGCFFHFAQANYRRINSSGTKMHTQ
jgi:transposase-like protein